MKSGERINCWLCALLFLSGTLCFSGVSDYSNWNEMDSGFFPAWFRLSASYIRWGMFALISILSIRSFAFIRKFSTSTQKGFMLFFLLLFLVSCLTGDIFRYGLMAIAIGLIPLWISRVVAESGEARFIRMLSYASVVLMLVSVCISLRAGTTFVRYTGFVVNANAFAGINLFLTLCCLAGFFVERSAWRKILFGLAVLGGVCGQLFCASRAGLACMAIGGTVFLWKSGHLNFKYVVMGGLGISVALLIFISNSSDFLLRVFEFGGATSDTGRADIWNTVFGYLRQNPLGFGTLAREEFGIGNCHNMYVALLFMCGYVGGAILIAIFIVTALSSLSPLSSKNIPQNVVFVRALGGAYIVTMLFYCLAEDSLLGLGAPWFIYLMISIGMLGYANNLRYIPLAGEQRRLNK